VAKQERNPMNEIRARQKELRKEGYTPDQAGRIASREVRGTDKHK